MRTLFVALAVATAVVSAACGAAEEGTQGAAEPVLSDDEQFTTTASGLQYRDLELGTGATPQAGNTISVHYTGWLTDGTKFDSSLDRGRPIEFPLGQGRVIRGWDEGLASMKVGGKRKLVIPSDLAYGDQGVTEADGTQIIGPGATLVFQVELLGIVN